MGDHPISRAKTRERRWLIMQFLKTYHHNFVRHLIEANSSAAYALTENLTHHHNVLNRVQGES